VTSNTGVTISNQLPFFGAPFESNAALAARCRARLQSLSPGGPKGAYQYFALSAGAILAAETPPILLSAPVARVTVVANTHTGTVEVLVATAAGTVPGIVNLAITAATNASPIAITTASPHGLSTSNQVIIEGVTGNTAANGTWTITSTGPSSFTLNGSTGNATYLGGGVVEGGDLGAIDSVIQANAVPDSVTAITQSAVAWNVAIAATIVVPQSKVATYAANAQTALAVYFASLPIGGVTSQLQYNDIIGVLWAAGSMSGQQSYVQAIPALTLNGVAGNVSYPSPDSVAILSPSPVLTVQGV
jgi:hypothetical protein